MKPPKSKPIRHASSLTIRSFSETSCWKQQKTISITSYILHIHKYRNANIYSKTVNTSTLHKYYLRTTKSYKIPLNNISYGRIEPNWITYAGSISIEYIKIKKIESAIALNSALSYSKTPVLLRSAHSDQNITEF